MDIFLAFLWRLFCKMKRLSVHPQRVFDCSIQVPAEKELFDETLSRFGHATIADEFQGKGPQGFPDIPWNLADHYFE